MKKTLTSYLILISLSFFSQEKKAFIGTWILEENKGTLFIELKKNNEFNYASIDSKHTIKIVKGTWVANVNNLELKIGDKTQKISIEKIDNDHIVLNNNNNNELFSMNRLKSLSTKNTLTKSFVINSIEEKTFKIHPESKKGLFKIKFNKHNKAQVYLYTAMAEVAEFEVPWKVYKHKNQLLLIISDFAVFSINTIETDTNFTSIKLFSYRMPNPKFIGSELILKEEIKTIKKQFTTNLEYASQYVGKTKKHLNKLDSLYKKNWKTKAGSLEGKELTSNYFKQTDSILNDIYKKTLARYTNISKNSASIGVPLREKTGYINAQKTWIKFKEIETDFLCNSYESREGWHKGLYTSCLRDKIRLTKERIEHLLKHYNGIRVN